MKVNDGKYLGKFIITSDLNDVEKVFIKGTEEFVNIIKSKNKFYDEWSSILPNEYVAIENSVVVSFDNNDLNAYDGYIFHYYDRYDIYGMKAIERTTKKKKYFLLCF